MSTTSDDAKSEPVEGRAPLEMRDPRMRAELAKAIIWVSVVLSVVLVYVLAQPLLLIVGGLVFASMLDGGARLLGRILPIPRGWRVALVAILALAFLLGVFSYAGLTLIGQFQALKTLVMNQFGRLESWANALGIAPKGGPDIEGIGRQLMGSLGQLTSAVGVALGGISSLAMIVVLGLFFAAEPRMYERGFAWLLPADKREGFFQTSADMARTLRRLMAGRLLGMAAEGFFIWIALSIVGVPFALLLGLITGILAFLPNIGAIVSGVLTVLVGFSAGSTTGFLAIGVYVLVQVFDGYVVVPTVARRSVDLAPALVLGMQLLLGALFGLLGLMFADPLVAMTKVALERKSGLDPEDEARKTS
ncbi:AI-2E family transporter [Sphingomonas abietis]|uniref:AI-2E family transporter n=1 Tax=Sphingomonas abietis TaxID=3012344 RepID=A0ABY7NQQ0_9SPHN|nr:AI-2E family transporter [Sphingomonas abietis]WBO22948.1 AI-2E family transporter [Sphingomonas abietis]